MNAVQFGRWFSERRRSGGWPSQRLLAEAAQHHAMVCRSNPSEDFLSRLEAGHLAHPFRGTVRRRIFLLAWLLCRTPRDLKAYLKAAGLNECSEEENALLYLLHEHLTEQQTPPLLLLPARPVHLQGRAEELEQVMGALDAPETSVLAITGMPGVGKSALACEALHQLAALESERPRHFPDGIATFTCTGRQGTRGLISLLLEIIALFTPGSSNPQGNSARRQARKRARTNAAELPFAGESEPELASLLDRARAALAHKRVLILLDDLDPAFPLRQALDVLLAQGAPTSHETKAENTQYERRVILTAGQSVPSPALVSLHLHLRPLPEEAAIALLSELIDAEINKADLVYARQVCAAVGYLPLAIASMATAILAQRIPLALVAIYLGTHPLGGLLDSEEEIVAEMGKALSRLEAHMRAGYLLLATLELPAFDLQTAAAILAPQRLLGPCQAAGRPAVQRRPEPTSTGYSATGTAQASPDTLTVAGAEREKLARLAGTAAILGQFVRLSLLELVPGTQGPDAHYRMHALLYHYARTLAHTLPAERLEMARQNLSIGAHYSSIRQDGTPSAGKDGSQSPPKPCLWRSIGGRVEPGLDSGSSFRNVAGGSDRRGSEQG